MAGVALVGTLIFGAAIAGFNAVIFLIVRQANKAMPPPAAGPTEVDLLAEIRDELKKK